MNPERLASYFLSYLPSLGSTWLVQYFVSYLLPLGSTRLIPILTWVWSFLDPLISYSQRRQIIHREFVGSSFNIDDRLSSWPIADAQSQPLVMKFHNDWGHRDCPVMKWYRDHKSSSSPTTFDSIQHRRNIDKPFYHEFLQIRLHDGRICVVERMGNGPDTDALRWTGCTSKDIIQCFSQSQYDKWSRTRPRSRIVTKLKLPRTFDLIDILAICYTIRRHAQAKNYTLQRFNCYFLCCTIFSILVRRTVSWEEQIGSVDWNDIINIVLGDLAHYDPDRFSSESLPPIHSFGLQHQPSWRDWIFSFWRDSESSMSLKNPSEPAYEASDYSHDVIKYIAIGICSLLDPDNYQLNPASANFVSVLLRSRLNELARINLIEGVSRCLWKERLQSTILHAIKRPVWNTTNSIKTGAASGSKKLCALLGPEDKVNFPQDELDFSSIQKAVQAGFFRAFIKVCHHHIAIARANYRIESFEGGYPRWKRVVTFIAASIVTLLTYPAVLLFPNFILGAFGELRSDLVILDMCKTFHVTPRSMVLAFPPGVLVPQFQYFALGMFNSNAEHTAERRRGIFDWSMHLANAWAEELAKILRGFICSDSPNIRGALAFLNSVLPGHIWEDCLLTCVGEAMDECVQGIVDQSGEKVEVCINIGPNGEELHDDLEEKSQDEEQGRYPSYSWTIGEFQEYLLSRIRKHARRVDRYQLAGAPVVESGIASTMTDIWASLPEDFGKM